MRDRRLHWRYPPADARPLHAPAVDPVGGPGPQRGRHGAGWDAHATGARPACRACRTGQRAGSRCPGRATLPSPACGRGPRPGGSAGRCERDARKIKDSGAGLLQVRQLRVRLRAHRGGGRGDSMAARNHWPPRCRGVGRSVRASPAGASPSHPTSDRLSDPWRPRRYFPRLLAVAAALPVLGVQLAAVADAAS